MANDQLFYVGQKAIIYKNGEITCDQSWDQIFLEEKFKGETDFL
jgi:hypothetical protein